MAGAVGDDWGDVIMAKEGVGRWGLVDDWCGAVVMTGVMWLWLRKECGGGSWLMTGVGRCVRTGVMW